mmetsp:Transcript_1505/g.4508  ORF Transcript_1505/g.4508 Transcript_1505/m.4508 type:complete len:333 (+) Transcript_1505:117-1115(+)
MEGAGPPASSSSQPAWAELVQARRRYLDSVCELMRRALPVKDRRSFGILYRDCLDAKEIVAWLVSGDFCQNSKEAVEIGRALQKQKYMVHIWGSHTVLVPFNDSTMYFRFTDKGLNARASESELAEAPRESRRQASRILLDGPQEEEGQEEAAAEEVDSESPSPCRDSETAGQPSSVPISKDSELPCSLDSRKECACQDTDIASSAGQIKLEAAEETSGKRAEEAALEDEEEQEQEVEERRQQHAQHQKQEQDQEEHNADRARRRRPTCEWVIPKSPTLAHEANRDQNEVKARLSTISFISGDGDAVAPSPTDAVKKKSVRIDLTGLRQESP